MDEFFGLLGMRTLRPRFADEEFVYPPWGMAPEMAEAPANAAMAAEGVTVVITVYNERDRIGAAVSQIVEVCNRLGRPYQVRIVDDGSTDWSDELERSLVADEHVSIRHLFPNRGKGAAMNETFPAIGTPWTVAIDGDNEYAASDIPVVLAPLLNDQADWVLGSRYGFGRKRPRQYLLTYLANQVCSGLFSALSGVPFRDLLTGLFAFRTRAVAGVRLQEERFAYTPELLWKVHRLHHPRWLDVPVSYRFRTYREGKKIRWWETFTVIRSIVKYRFARLPQPASWVAPHAE